MKAGDFARDRALLETAVLALFEHVHDEETARSFLRLAEEIAGEINTFERYVTTEGCPAGCESGSVKSARKARRHWYAWKNCPRCKGKGRVKRVGRHSLEGVQA